MANSVTFSKELGGDGKTYTDDADPNTGLDGLGYTTRFIPVLKQGMLMAMSAKDNAQAAASYVQQCQMLRQAVGNDRLAVAADLQHVDRQKMAVDQAASEAAQSAASVSADNIVHAPGSGLSNEAGEAYKRNVVGGEGRLVVEGYAGLGSVGGMQVLSAINITTIPHGDYIVQGIPIEQRPPGASGFAYVSIDRYNNNNVRIEYSPIGSQSTGNRKWWTTFNSTTGKFLPWAEVITTANVVGSMSYEDSVVRGSIIERDSNDDGEWVKFADGTMICFNFGFERTVTATNTDSLPNGWVRYGLGSGNQIVFPQPFTESPVMSFNNRNPVPESRYKYGVQVDMGVTISGTEARPQIIFPHGPQTSTPVFLSYMAIGRWY
ncbi:hypothetical protein [Vreelandella populi]|uniref:hypothetical protein n=1 Tax=Vreelandella populi TaxID=2498858 RepID=UPI000F8D4AA1|nr:hypothetical protein [Halomonas populi]RUR51534.1 hypothetical protein ELY40_17205 [Halomonas populi]